MTERFIIGFFIDFFVAASKLEKTVLCTLSRCIKDIPFLVLNPLSLVAAGLLLLGGSA
jgi:hypothetical protein